eukprot:jgi/Mesen1/7315/ME000376S06479
MVSLTCNGCNIVFPDESSRAAHYKGDWHRYNLKRKIAGLPGVTESWFEKRRDALAAERGSDDAPRMIFRCTLCGKDYGSAKAHANHLLSRLHVHTAAAAPAEAASHLAPLIRPAPARFEGDEDEENEEGAEKEQEDGEGEWEEVDDDMEEAGGTGAIEDGEAESAGLAGSGEWDVASCLFCTTKPKEDLEACAEHMHREHGFFIPDADYLKDPQGMLQYLGLKVTQGHMCVYCDRQFRSADAVRKHMATKSHCKLRYGDGSGLGEEELEDFYSFDSDGEQDGWHLVPHAESEAGPVALTTSGAELALAGSGGEQGGQPKVLGSRDMARYYRQQPRPSESRDGVLVNAVAARYRSMGLATKQQEWRGTYPRKGTQADAVRAAQRIKHDIAAGSNSSAHWGR